MAEMLPFRGLRYASSYANPSVFAPPYDVISPVMRGALTAGSPYNITHIDVTPPAAPADWYAAAAGKLAQWQRDGILVQDTSPAYYGYCQHFVLADGSRHTRRGLFALVRLAEWGQGIYRHEHTRAGPRADRLKLMRATQAQLSPVFGMISDPRGQLSAWLTPPAVATVDYIGSDGTEQMSWPVDDPAQIAAIQRFLAPCEIVIADGHHRYETALAYRAERRAAEGNPRELKPYDYVLMYLTAYEDRGLVILPTHRIITADQMPTETELLAQLEQRFRVMRIDSNEPLERLIRPLGTESVTIGMYLGRGSRWVCRDRHTYESGTHVDVSELDVSVLQEGILDPCFGIDAAALRDSERVAYTISEAEACAAVDGGQAQAAFVLNPTSLEQVWQTARNLETMPQKSTYFYPKLLTGLVIHTL